MLFVGLDEEDLNIANFLVEHLNGLTMLSRRFFQLCFVLYRPIGWFTTKELFGVTLTFVWQFSFLECNNLSVVVPFDITFFAVVTTSHVILAGQVHGQ